MKKEREEDAKRMEEVRKEREKEMKGEGAWITSGGQRRKKGKGKAMGIGMGMGMGRGMGRGFAEVPKSAPPGVTTFMGMEGGAGGRASKTGEFAKDEPLSANEAHGMERARSGPWPRPNGAKNADASEDAFGTK